MDSRDRNKRAALRRRKRMRILRIRLLTTMAFLITTVYFAWKTVEHSRAEDKVESMEQTRQYLADTLVIEGETAPIPIRDNSRGTTAAGVSKEEEWKLRLVNPWNSLPEDYAVTLTNLKDGHAIDERCYPDLQNMMDDCRAAGLSPLICSSYRTNETQKRLFEDKVSRLLSQGYSQEKARTEAAKAVAVPGTSEHQLGLALDIVDVNNQNLDESQENTEVQKWLMEHSWEYGFILRYPNGKSQVTGIIYEPWHYRYVGKEAAREIYEQGICLEEYLER